MTQPTSKSGYFRCGLPYNRTGHGPSPLVVFPGQTVENRPQSGGPVDVAIVPPMVAGAADDFFYRPMLFRETAAGIAGARLCLYENVGHPAGGRRFRSDVLAFLREIGDGSGQRR